MLDADPKQRDLSAFAQEFLGAVSYLWGHLLHSSHCVLLEGVLAVPEVATGYWGGGEGERSDRGV